MTVRQRRFLEEYLNGFDAFNATQSAIRAGYSVKTAYSIGARLLKRSDIAAIIEEALQRMRDAALADAYEVEHHLTAVMRGETSAETIVMVGRGRGKRSARKVTKAPDGMERLKAAEILAKRHGLTDSRLKMTHLVPPVFSGAHELE